MRKLFVATAVLLMMASCCNCKVTLLDSAAFQREIDGNLTDLYTIRNGRTIVQITNFGARVVSLWVPDRRGRMQDIEIGYENIDRYINNTGERFLGAIVGPVANRICNGEFVLDGVKYTTPKNDGNNTLHGGIKGVDMIVWDVIEHTDNSLCLSCNLPDGQDGFPGNRSLQVEYFVDESGELQISFIATTDAPTVMNLSSHVFFNLHGEGNGDILDHEIWIDSKAITPINSELIPTGELMDVSGTPFDFSAPTAIGKRIGEDSEQLKFGAGYDHNWIIDRRDRNNVIKFADLYDPKSGRGIEVWSDEIGLQFYSGNFFDGSYVGKYGKPILYRGALALETQHYPDSPNHPDFPSVELRPGEIYARNCIYKFYTK